MDWLLSGLVLAGNYLLKGKSKWGWVVLCLNSLGWIYYAFTLEPVQYGLVPAAAINFGISLAAVIRWAKEEKHG
jgi:hypothetical protein